MKYKYLFTPAKIGSLELKNRCIMAPMSAALANPDGTVSDELIAYFVARAKGGMGLIMTEYAFVQPNGRSSDHQISVAEDSMIPGLARLAEAVHENGAKICLQLQHGGRRSCVESTAPSPIPFDKGHPTPRVLTTAEVYKLVDDFVAGAVRAKKAGYDMVEVHCAHGYLLNDFVSPRANRRVDEFGGSMEGRARAAVMIIRGIKEACGADYPVSVRLSGEELVTDGNRKRDAAAMAQLFEEAGADLINVSCGVNGVGYGIAPAAKETGHNVEAAEEIHRVVDCAVSVAGRINEPEYAEAILRAGKAEFVSFGRALFADPEFANKAMEGREEEICPCVGCLQRCYGSYGHGGVYRSCMVNPFAMRETTMKLEPAEVKKKIVVVGAGPAGMEAAWTAAARGHAVTLYEKEASVGGQFQIAAMPPHKQLLARAITYYYRMCQKYGVEMHFNTEADKALILAQKPDAVILATGGTPIRPRIPGMEEVQTLYGSEVLMGAPLKGDRCLVIGGGSQGAETADYLGQLGYEAAVVEMRDGIALDDAEATRRMLLERFAQNHVQCYTGATVKHVYADGVDYEKDGEIKSLRGYDNIIISIGVRSFNPLEEQLKGEAAQVITIGDASEAKNAVNALYVAAVTGTTI
ncbi:MAG TPA: NAD(P)/FAD-dependent oxidoreductase [Candidatus Enterocloster excrementipullorum]|uniref:NAD(P)/FAD-dependent oxidoreductase n=1 Tax=Candidatus Enterocloster excrementipullorum TaxID=2838559 RepID=A0A9D2N1H8_9FIRM|nr:NAD(P)/FAD-dependent oxidoreductase [Candidatus Enterocloster excrementipullorum]